jgi:hypothetical protein
MHDLLILFSTLGGLLLFGVLGFIIGSDKKRRGDRIHFVIPRLPGQTEIELVGLDEVRAALEQA